MPPPHSTPLFSIVIPTINRVLDVVNILNSICQQTVQRIEVIIVDQNEDIHLLDNIEVEFKQKFPLIRIQTSIKGASHARNIGIAHASGIYIMFPDDDCEFTDNLLLHVEKKFIEEPYLSGICIITKDKEDKKKIALLKNKEAIISSANILSTVIEAGIILKRDIIQSNRFDENLGVGNITTPFWSDEGPDFILQFINKGVLVKYVPDLYFYHPNPVKQYDEKTALRAYNYGLGRGYFLRKNHFSMLYIMIYLMIYVVGMMIAIVKYNKYMLLYFINGFKGRFQGYFYTKVLYLKSNMPK